VNQRTKKLPSSKISANFIEPMLLLRTEALPDDSGLWRYEIKHDGYRAVAFKTRGKLHLRSRNDNDFALRYRPDWTDWQKNNAKPYGRLADLAL
jgi:ATP-dependent DNA ligase